MPLRPHATSTENPSYSPIRAKCGQCGKELRHVPFALNNIMCRECYGLERYRRGGGGMAAPERAAAAVAEESVTA